MRVGTRFDKSSKFEQDRSFHVKWFEYKHFMRTDETTNHIQYPYQAKFPFLPC